MRKIAIIDDDEVFQLIIRKQIEMNNFAFEILNFSNGADGINYLTGNAEKPDQLPHLIMLDVNMPIKNGWEFLEEYGALDKEIRNSISLYMVTSSVIQSDIDKVQRDKNVLAFISKPITNQKLEEMLG
jgi:CheY-like chemotaxis protein